MRNLQLTGLALLFLGVCAAGVSAVEGAGIPSGVVPSELHWIHRAGGDTYYFDCHHGAWSARLTDHKVTVSARGTIAVKDRDGFYQGLAANGCWVLPTPPDADTLHYDKLQWNYVVATPHYEHHAYFNADTQSNYSTLVNYVDGTLVGQEEKALQARLSK